MTMERKSEPHEARSGQLSISGLPEASALLKIRVLPSEFSRLLGVSRTAVSKWIKAGILTPGIDGRLDATAATRRVLERVDLGRTRSRVLRAAAGDLAELRQSAAEADERVAAVQAQLDAATARCAELEHFGELLAETEAVFADKIIEAADELRSLDPVSWPPVLERLQAEAWSSVINPAPAGAISEETCT